MTDRAETVRVLLVDDDPAVRSGVRFMLSLSEDISIVGEVDDGDRVVEAVQAHHPDVVLLDVRMNRQDGITTVGAVKRLKDAPKVLMFTVFDHGDVAQRAIEAGADGFLLKTAAPEQIAEGIRNVASGFAAVSPKTAAQLFTRVREDSASAQRARARGLVARLTERERDVLRGMGQGLTNAEIARTLHVSETTVKTYVASAFDKLECDNRATAAVIADRAGLLGS